MNEAQTIVSYFMAPSPSGKEAGMKNCLYCRPEEDGEKALSGLLTED